MDGWSEHFDLDVWLKAGRDCGMDLETYLAGRDQTQILPWQHLDTRVDVSFLQAERAKALAGEYTPDCRVHGCQKCGVCDFKEIMPRVYRPAKDGIQKFTSDEGRGSTGQVDPQEPGFSYRIAYSRLGEVRFLSHLELIQVFFRALNRMEANLRFSHGFNPTPKVSFSPALPVGTESLAEFLDVELERPLSDPEEFLARLNQQLPAGLEGKGILLHTERGARDSGAMLFRYRLSFPRPFTEEEKERIAGFAAAERFVIRRVKKGRALEYDIRPQVQEFKVIGDAEVELSLLHESGKAVPKPHELLQGVLEIADHEVLRTRVVKISREAVL